MASRTARDQMRLRATTPRPKPRPRTIPRPKNLMAPWSPDLMEQEANVRVNHLLDPQMDAARRDSASRIATIQAAASAAAQLLAGHATQTQEGYRQATADVQGIGGGYSDEMKARMTAAQQAAAQFAATQGAPGAPGAPVDVAALGDSVYHGGVGIPGSSLASQGAAATAEATAMAGIPALQGQQDIALAARQGEQALLDLAAKRPELHDGIMDVLFKQEMDKLQGRLSTRQTAVQERAQDLYASQFGETVRSNKANENLKRREQNLSWNQVVLDHQDAIAKAQAEGRQPNASLSKAYGYIVDGQGRPVLNKNGGHIPVAQSTTAKSKKAKSNAQYQKAVGEASDMFEASRPTAPAAPGLPAGPPEHKWKWGDAMRYLQNRYGLKKAAARRALIAAGFKAPARPGTYPNTGPYANTSPRR